MTTDPKAILAATAQERQKAFEAAQRAARMLEEAIPHITIEAERLRAIRELEQARHLVRLFSPETTEHIAQFLDANPDATAEDLRAELVRWDKET